MGILLFIIGLVSTGIAGFILAQALIMRNWTAVTAEILSAQVVRQERHDMWGVASYFYPQVTYRYQIKGKRYTSSRYRLFPLALSEHDASDITNDLSHLTQITAYYNPVRKGSAVVEREINRMLLIYMSLLGLIGIVLMVSAFV
jgi:hypothetical protein